MKQWLILEECAAKNMTAAEYQQILEAKKLDYKFLILDEFNCITGATWHQDVREEDYFKVLAEEFLTAPPKV